MLNRLKFEEPSKADVELENVVRFMRGKSLEYNQEHPTSDMIVNDVNILTEGAINLTEEWMKRVETEHKSAASHQKNTKRQQRTQRQSQKSTRKSGQRHNTHK